MPFYPHLCSNHLTPLEICEIQHMLSVHLWGRLFRLGSTDCVEEWVSDKHSERLLLIRYTALVLNTSNKLDKSCIKPQSEFVSPMKGNNCHLNLFLSSLSLSNGLKRPVPYYFIN